MPYTINKSNGRLFLTIPDGSIDSTTDLQLLGKNYAGYGQIIAQNFVYLLENFSKSTPPAKPIQGQLWFDSSTAKLKVYDGTNFRSISNTTVGSSEPSSSSDGDFWFDTRTNQLKIKYGETFSTISGSGTGSGTGVGLSLSVIKDVGNVSHSVLKVTVNDTSGRNVDVGVFSSDAFSVSPSESPEIYGSFPYLSRGLSLIGANSFGKSSTALSNGTLLWGTTTHALAANRLAVDTLGDYNASVSPLPATVVARDNLGRISASAFLVGGSEITNGFTGSRGFDGSAITGFTGSRGVVGFTGSAGGGGGGSGFTGSRGDAGFTGSRGFDGSRGYTGSGADVNVLNSFGSLYYPLVVLGGGPNQPQYIHVTAAGFFYDTSSFTVFANDFAATSDERLKNVQGKIQNPIEKIKNIDGLVYTWNKEAEDQGIHEAGEQTGVIAQQVSSVMPQAVVNANGYLRVKYDKLIPLLIEAIKDQQQQIDQLKAAINDHL
jgi:hypothetical protein